MILYPATSTHNHLVSDCSGDWSTSDHSNRSWTKWQGRSSCSGLTQLVKSWESLAYLQLCSGSPVGRWWRPCSYRLAAHWLVCGKPLGVQLEYVGPWVFGSISAAAPWEGRFMTHSMPSTSSAGSSGCSHVDRFGSHFKQCRTGDPREGTCHPPNFQFMNAKWLGANIVKALTWWSFSVTSIPISSTHTVKFTGNAIQHFRFVYCETFGH